MPEAKAVQSMFARISGRYDLLNRTLSGGVDQRWRRKVVRAAGPIEGRVAVDVACGTGDLALLLAEAGARVVGVDFTHEMLVHGPRKERRARAEAWVQGDALRLPLQDGVAACATIAFGLRNVEDRRRGMEELRRVVEPGGRVLVLECGLPKNRVFGSVYRTYFDHVLPRLGGLISGDRAAYEYLPETVAAWPGPDQLADELRAVRLESVGYESLFGGVAYLHRGVRPHQDGA